MKIIVGTLLSVFALVILVLAGVVIKNTVSTLSQNNSAVGVVIECKYKRSHGSSRRTSRSLRSSYAPIAVTETGDKAIGTKYLSRKAWCESLIGNQVTVFVHPTDAKKNVYGSFLQFWFFPFMLMLFVIALIKMNGRVKTVIILGMLMYAAFSLLREFDAFGLGKKGASIEKPIAKIKFDACVEKHLREQGVSGREELKKLECYPTPNIEAFNEFPKLETVSIDNADFTSLEQIPFLENLKKLSVKNPNLISFSGLERLEKLEELSLYKVSFASIEQLPALPNLDALVIVQNSELKNLSGIERFTSLKSLELQRNAINTISSISKISGLEKIYMEFEPVDDLSPLQNLNRLEVARFRTSKISDFSPLFSKPNMRHSGAVGSNISCDQMKLWMASLDPEWRKFMWLPKHCQYLKDTIKNNN